MSHFIKKAIASLAAISAVATGSMMTAKTAQADGIVDTPMTISMRDSIMVCPSAMVSHMYSTVSAIKTKQAMIREATSYGMSSPREAADELSRINKPATVLVNDPYVQAIDRDGIYRGSETMQHLSRRYTTVGLDLLEAENALNSYDCAHDDAIVAAVNKVRQYMKMNR